MKYRTPLLCLLFVLLFSLPAGAAAKPALLKDVHLNSSGELEADVTIPDISKVPGNRIFLYALPFTGTRIEARCYNLANRAKAKTVHFRVNLKKKYSTYINCRYAAVAVKSDGTRVIISNFLYPTKMNSVARYRYTFPTGLSKKGLQIKEGMDEDIEELGVQHSVINIVFTEMLSARSESNSSVSIPYKYNGTTYWFRKYMISYYDRQLKALKRNNAVVSAILLLGYRSDLTSLIPTAGRETGHTFYAWNTGSSSARNTFAACLSFLSERYGASNGANGRIVNWIVGNEVNDYDAWFFGGRMSLSSYARLYASAFRLTYNVVTSYYAGARVYISLDYMWNTRARSWTFTGRETLDSFAKAIKAGGNIPWNLAYHPYSCPLTEPRFWENKNHMLTASLSSPVINMKNLSLLTTYIRETYGRSTRIILSEQGYTSVQNGKNVQKDQSAAIVYSYYLAEADDMVDSFIMNRHVDHMAEVSGGLSCGLWTTSGTENAASKKNSWTVYKYMDTSRSPTVAKSSLSVIGISSWSEVIPEYSSALYQKTDSVIGKLNILSGYRKTAGIKTAWKPYGAVRSSGRIKNGVAVVHNDTVNANRLWGLSQTFSAPLSFASHPWFYTTLKISGARADTVRIKLRIFSGKNTFECSRTLRSGTAYRLGTSLASWKYKNKITKIQLLVEPVKGGWKKDAGMRVIWPVRGRG